MAPQWKGNESEEDTITIMVATDNHLGYLEKDPVRGDDSFIAFEEILALAAESEVDMILLGGDLFHENKPSRKTMYNTTKLLRKYCLGDKPVSLEFLSNPTDNFPEGIKNVNYMDPNLNVAIPVFSIHGNHDDPSGDGNLCALDQLSMAGLVNYFGRSQEIDNVIVKPVLLQKGATRLALYGIGNIRDERLHQTFLRRNVKMMRPVEDEEDPWYNLLVIHQNRVMHGPKNYIPEAFLDDFIDLVIWGHEHECLIDPVYNPQQNFHVSQPGSSVATSLSEGESKEKHVAIVKICQGKFDIQKIQLQTVRPFVMDDLALSEHGLDPSDEQKVNRFISKKVREMVKKANDEWLEKNGRGSRKRRVYSMEGSDEEEPAEIADTSQTIEIPKPLIRLRVDYSGGFEIFNPQRFGQEFVDIVANPRDIIHFFRRKTTAPTTRHNTTSKVEIDKAEALEKQDAMRVEDLVQKYLSAQTLNLLPEVELADAVRVYVEKDEKDALKDFVASSLERMQKAMRNKQNIEIEEALLKEINREKNIQAESYARDHPSGHILERRRRSSDNDMEVDPDEDNSDDGSDNQSAKHTSKTRKSNDKKAASSSSKASRGSKKPEVVLDTDDDEADLKPKRGARSAKGSHQTKAVHVVLDSEDDGDANDNDGGDDDDNVKSDRYHMVDDSEDDEEQIAKPNKGKSRAKSPVKPKPVTKPTKPSAAQSKQSASSAKVNPARVAASSRTASQTASQSQSQSQTPSRLISSIGSRKKKLM